MDIYHRLKDDHGKQRGLSAGLLETSGDTSERQRLFDALSKEIQAHAAAEEQTFYAELIANPDGQEKARHSVSEHEEAASLLDELKEMDMASGGWLNKFKKLKEELDHHLDEEEAEVFKLAQKLIAKTRAEELGQEFDKRKKDELAG
jgi:iron-sulfur cluster repair protein YtfE (RIC family)